MVIGGDWIEVTPPSMSVTPADAPAVPPVTRSKLPLLVVPSCLVPLLVVVSGLARSQRPVTAVSVPAGFGVQPLSVSKSSLKIVCAPPPPVLTAPETTSANGCAELGTLNARTVTVYVPAAGARIVACSTLLRRSAAPPVVDWLLANTLPRNVPDGPDTVRSRSLLRFTLAPRRRDAVEPRRHRAAASRPRGYRSAADGRAWPASSTKLAFSMRLAR